MINEDELYSPNKGERQYLTLLEDLVRKLNYHSVLGKEIREDRTKVGCVSLFGRQLVFGIQNQFPLLTTKRVWWKGVAEELFWFLRGGTNINSLKSKGVNIWNEWATETGDVGPMYGSMWRDWPGREYAMNIDQIDHLIKGIQNKPNSRRHVVSAWNPTFLPDENKTPKENAWEDRQALAPCHCLFQFFVEDGYLDCQLYQRSADIFLGVPFNIASYSLLTYIIANICDLKPREFIHTFGDLHLYSNHLEAAQEQLSRESKEFPKLNINRKLTINDLETLTLDDFEIVGYDPHPTIKAPIAV